MNSGIRFSSWLFLFLQSNLQQHFSYVCSYAVAIPVKQFSEIVTVHCHNSKLINIHFAASQTILMYHINIHKNCDA